MKRVLSILVLVAVAGGAIWWLAVKRPADLAAAAQREQEANEAALNTQREAMFGAEALAADVQWRPTGLGFRIENEGEGPKPTVGTRVRMNYRGRLRDGTVFDQSKEPVVFAVGQMVPGMNAAAMMLGAGGKGTFFIPPALGYGRRAAGPIPANSGLIFEVEVLALNP